MTLIFLLFGYFFLFKNSDYSLKYLNKFRKLTFSTALLFPLILISQEQFSISGKITGVNGEPLSFVDVILNKDKKYTTTNENGAYELNADEGEYIISISSLGFEPLKKNIVLNKNLNLNFTLKEVSETLDNIVIQGKSVATKQKEKALTIGSFEVDDVIATTSLVTQQIDKISGVRVRRSGSLGGDSEISINGLTDTSIRTYIDGIPLEFLYPGLDISNIPLSNIERVDVFKGVVPLDVGTDALGGAINIISKDRTENNIEATYSIGSFNTHIASINATLVSDTKNYVSVTGGVAYSDNNYTFKTNVVTNELINENDPSLGTSLQVKEDQEVERFHDAYRLQYSGLEIGTSDKKWTDKAYISFNYLNIYDEIQNGNRIQNLSIGEAFNTSEDFSAILLYDKTILKDKIKLRTISGYGDETLKAVDSTSNQYNWLGDIINVQLNVGEIGNGRVTELKSKGYINRSSLTYDVNDEHRLLLSNIYAKRQRDVARFNFVDEVFFDLPKQEVTKNIVGIQYEGDYFDDKLKITASGKYYSYSLSVIDDLNDGLLSTKNDFFGWNAGFKYNLIPELAIRGSYEKGFLIPELSQFAGNPPLIRSNPLIEPEEGDNFNLGILYSQYFNEDYSLSIIANLFLREQQDIIFEPSTTGVSSQFINGENVDSKGVEGEVKFNFLKNFTWTTNVSYIDKVFSSVEDQFSQDLVGTPFPNTPSFFYNIQLDWFKKNIFKSKVNFTFYTSFNHIDTFNFRRLGGSDTVANSPELFVPENNKLDSGIVLQFLDKQLTTSFNINNITDEELFDNFSIPNPGRNFNIKLIYKLSNFKY